MDCGAPDGANSVTAFAVHQGSLYAGTGKYRVAGSSLPESPNTTLGGRIFRYQGTNPWLPCDSFHRPKPWVAWWFSVGHCTPRPLQTGFFPATKVARSGQVAERRRNPGGPADLNDNFLYASRLSSWTRYRYDGQTWVDCGALGDNTQTYSFTSYEGRLLVGTWPSGRVYRFDDIGRWTDLGRLGQELEVMGMAVHNGRLIAGTLPLAEVYSYEKPGSDWKRLAQLDSTPDVKYRRAWTLTERQGELFCGAFPSGNVFAFSRHQQVTS